MYRAYKVYDKTLTPVGITNRNGVVNAINLNYDKPRYVGFDNIEYLPDESLKDHITDVDPNVNDYYSKVDREFQDKYKISEESISRPYEINEDGDAYFPVLEKTVRRTDVERMKEAENDPRFKEVFSEGKELGESETENRNWYKQEVKTASDINDQLSEINDREIFGNGPSDIRFYACQVGGSSKSDVMVVADKRNPKTKKFNDGSSFPQNLRNVEYSKIRRADRKDSAHPGKEDDYFFVEVKLNYKNSAYFKFNMDYEITDGSSFRLYRATSKNPEFSEKLNERMMTLLQDSPELNDRCRTLNKNIKKCVDGLDQIEEIRDRFKLGSGGVKRLPEDFEKIARVFNFYILEWMAKLAYLKSTYLYEASGSNPSEKKLETILEKATLVKDRLGRLSNKQDVLKFTFIDKFKAMYSIFASGDRTKDVVDLRHTPLIFSYVADPDSQTVRDFLELICEYYYSEMDVRYIQIGSELFYLDGPDKSSNNPFGLDIPEFSDMAKKVGLKISVGVKAPSQNSRDFKLALKVFLLDDISGTSGSDDDFSDDKDESGDGAPETSSGNENRIKTAFSDLKIGDDCDFIRKNIGSGKSDSGKSSPKKRDTGTLDESILRTKDAIFFHGSRNTGIITTLEPPSPERIFFVTEDLDYAEEYTKKNGEKVGSVYVVSLKEGTKIYDPYQDFLLPGPVQEKWGREFLSYLAFGDEWMSEIGSGKDMFNMLMDIVRIAYRYTETGFDPKRFMESDYVKDADSEFRTHLLDMFDVIKGMFRNGEIAKILNESRPNMPWEYNHGLASRLRSLFARDLREDGY